MRILPASWIDDGTTVATDRYVMAGRVIGPVEPVDPDDGRPSPFPAFVARTHRMRQVMLWLVAGSLVYALLTVVLTVAVYGTEFNSRCLDPERECRALTDNEALLAFTDGAFVVGMIVCSLGIATAAGIFGTLLGRFSQIATTHMSPRLEGGDPAGTLAKRTDKVANTRRVLLRRDRGALIALAVAVVAATIAWAMTNYANDYYIGTTCAQTFGDGCLTWLDRGGAYAMFAGAVTFFAVAFVVYSLLKRIPVVRRLRRYAREAEAASEAAEAGAGSGASPARYL